MDPDGVGHHYSKILFVSQEGQVLGEWGEVLCWIPSFKSRTTENGGHFENYGPIQNKTDGKARLSLGNGYILIDKWSVSKAPNAIEAVLILH